MGNLAVTNTVGARSNDRDRARDGIMSPFLRPKSLPLKHPSRARASMSFILMRAPMRHVYLIENANFDMTCFTL